MRKRQAPTGVHGQRRSRRYRNDVIAIPEPMIGLELEQALKEILSESAAKPSKDKLH